MVPAKPPKGEGTQNMRELLEQRGRRNTCGHPSPMQALSAKQTKCIVASRSGDAVLAFTTWLLRQYGASLRCASALVQLPCPFLLH